MVSIPSSPPRFWILLGVMIFAGMLAAGCAPKQGPVPPGPTETAVNEELVHLEEMIAKTQSVVDAAVQEGARREDLKPTDMRITQHQAALDEARRLLAEGKFQQAMEVIAQALQEVEKTEAAAMQAKKMSIASGKARAQARMEQVARCIADARQAVQAAGTVVVASADIEPAQKALDRAEVAMQNAQTRLDAGELQRALQDLDAAQAECMTARDLAKQAGVAAVAAATRAAGKPGSYMVLRGDTLWGISGSTPIYDNPFMWPMIYKANRDQIRDPDLIYPEQKFAIPRNYSQEESTTAIQRARTRGPWRLGDGQDYYILEGVRR
ncbi:MAG: hypothetical protein V3R80_03260 [Candidatus Tectomicrobia bacterium]